MLPVSWSLSFRCQGTIDDQYVKALREVLDQQKEAGVELFTDGQLLWHNMLCHICYKIEGFSAKGLAGYFNNNMFYQVPEVVSELKRTGPIVLDEYRIARDIVSDVKPILSCYTLTWLSKNNFYPNDEFLMSLASILNEEAKALADAGAKIIQLDEPALLFAKELGIVEEALNVLVKGVNASFILSAYFSDASAIFPRILDFPVEGIGLDFVEGREKNLNLIKDYSLDLDLQAGVVNSRNTKMEKTSEVSSLLSTLSDLIDSKRIYVSPNTGLEYLPYEKAYEKLKILSKSVKEVLG